MVVSMRSRSEREEPLLEEVRDRFEDKGVRIWGKTATGDLVEVRVDADGKVETV